MIRRPPLFLVLLLALPTPFAMGIIVPSLGTISKDLSVPYALVQLLVTGFLLGMGLMVLVIGPLTDWLGRRPVLLTGLAIFVAGSLLGSFSDSIQGLVFFRLLQSAGAAACTVISIIVTRDSCDDATARRNITYIMAATEVGVLISTPIGGHLAMLAGWHSIFAATTVLGVILLVASIAFLPETRPLMIDKPGFFALFSNYRKLIRKPVFFSNVLAAALGGGSGLILLVVTPSILENNFHINVARVGDLFMLNSMVYVLGAMVVLRFERFVSPGPLLMGLLSISLFICLAFIVLLLGFGPLFWTVLISLYALSSVRAGILALGTTAAISSDLNMTGTASGLANSLISILTAVIGACGGAFYAGNLLPPALFMAVCLGIGFSAYGAFLFRNQSRYALK